MSIHEADLRSTYRQFTDEDLRTLWEQQNTLTDPARSILKSEFRRRGLEEPAAARPAETAEPAQFVTIRSYRDLSEAIVARTVLESAGIEAFLRDENLVRLDWQVSNFIGGIRLQVSVEDQQDADALINQPVPEEIPFDAESDFEQPHCPRCGSLEITFEGRSRGAAIVSLFFFSLPLPFGSESWRCASCGAHWQQRPGSTPQIAE